MLFSEETFHTAIFTALAFGLAWLIALLTYKFSAWRDVDLLYYPIGAIGVVLLAVGLDANRADELISKSRFQAAASIEEIKNAPPLIDGFDFPPERRLSSKELIESLIGFARACENSTQVTAKCLSATNLTPYFEEAFHGFSAEYASDELAVNGICSGFGRILESMSSDHGTVSSIAKQASDFVSRKLDEKIPWSAVENDIEGPDDFFAETSRYWNGVFGDDESVNPTVRDWVYSNISNFRILLIAHGFCMRLPASISDGTFERWHQERTDRINDLETQLDQSLKAIKYNADQVELVSQWREKNWKFFLLAALALKFGKGVAERKRRLG